MTTFSKQLSKPVTLHFLATEKRSDTTIPKNFTEKAAPVFAIGIAVFHSVCEEQRLRWQQKVAQRKPANKRVDAVAHILFASREIKSRYENSSTETSRPIRFPTFAGGCRFSFNGGRTFHRDSALPISCLLACGTLACLLFLSHLPFEPLSRLVPY